MSWLASLVAARARGVLVLAVCGASAACFDGGRPSPAHSRCGHTRVVDVYWSASGAAGSVGAWYGGAGSLDGSYSSGDWYDPGDGYDPATNSGGIGADPGDGSGWDQPDDGSGDSSSDPGGDPSADNGDSSGDGSGDGSGDSSGDSSGESVTRLHLYSTNTPSAPSVAGGCFSCTMGCRTDAASPTGRQAIGASDIGPDDACTSAVRTLAQWAHDARREKIVSCQRIATP